MLEVWLGIGCVLVGSAVLGVFILRLVILKFAPSNKKFKICHSSTDIHLPPFKAVNNRFHPFQVDIPLFKSFGGSK